MSETPSVSKKPHFRALKVEPYEPQEFLPGMRADDEVIDVSCFSPYRYVVTFEYRTGWRRKWRKVRALA